MSIAIVPGSYDPITLGHLDVIERALELYDEVVVAVMNNAEKQYWFTLAERAELAKAATAHLARVRVIADEGWLVDVFDRVGATAIVKGVRNDTDRAYEEKMAEYNLSRNPRAKTVLLKASEELLYVSSTAVREKMKAGEGIGHLVPPAALALLEAKQRSKHE